MDKTGIEYISKDIPVLALPANNPLSKTIRKET